MRGQNRAFGAWPHIDPGKKRHQIEIQGRGATTQDSTGGQSGAWNVIHPCYAQIETRSAGEQFQGGFVSEVIHIVSIDWVPVAIRAGMRVVVKPYRGANASVYLIQAIENVQQRDLVFRITCTEIDSAKVGS